MTKQNRVDPFGKFHSIRARGELMGNRGILHDDAQQILRTHAHQNWVACALSFKGRHREIMQPGKYTELFFLDEATAFAAGHRPCAECRRERYNEFTECWRTVHGEPRAGKSMPQTIDWLLHSHRIARGGQKVTFEAMIEELPDGTIFAGDDRAVLVWNGRQFDWSFHGYVERAAPETGMVSVLTPRPVFDLFRHGFQPHIHRTAFSIV
jgi:hypothetical protein